MFFRSGRRVHKYKEDQEGLKIDLIDMDEPEVMAFFSNNICIERQTRAFAFLEGSPNAPKYFRAIFVKGC